MKQILIILFISSFFTLKLAAQHGASQSELPKSKSERTLDPTVITVTRVQFLSAKTIQDLVPSIPAGCNVSAFEFTVKIDGNVVVSRNTGNELQFKFDRGTCNSISFDNILSACPKSHKANYKLLIK